MKVIIKTTILALALVLGVSYKKIISKKDEMKILDSKKLVFTPIKDENKDLEALYLLNSKRNKGRINGSWKISNHSELGADYRNENVRLEMVGLSKVVLISSDRRIEGEFYIADLSRKSIKLFKTNLNEISHIDLRLISLDPSKKVLEINETKLVVESKSKKRNVLIERNEFLKLNKAYDARIRRIVKDNLTGSIDISGGQIIAIDANVNGVDLTVNSINTEDGNNFIYESNGQSGSAHGDYVNSKNYSLYFISGPYKGYTLIFSKEKNIQKEIAAV